MEGDLVKIENRHGICGGDVEPSDDESVEEVDILIQSPQTPGHCHLSPGLCLIRFHPISYDFI
jgi:hypothetical protein